MVLVVVKEAEEVHVEALPLLQLLLLLLQCCYQQVGQTRPGSPSLLSRIKAADGQEEDVVEEDAVSIQRWGMSKT